MLKSLYLTEQEVHILELASRIKFGEILSAETGSPERTKEREVTDGQQRFVQLIREERWPQIDRIAVHNGEPATVEVEGEDDGLKYKIKRKI
jgi:hypothetical protein